MLAVGGEGRRAAAGLQGADQGGDLGVAEDRLLEGLDVADKADALGDVGGHGGFEGAAADEGDDGVQVLGGDAEGGFQGLEVFVVLPQRVLELVAVLVELLRPLGLLFAAEDPAAHVLGLQHEDAVAGEEDVVDLGGAVRGIQGDVVQAVVGLPVELPVCEEPDEEFADIAFAEGGFEQADEDHQRDEPGEGGPDLGDERCEVHFRHS